jgi:BirA family transcriptional regulator, biotin operon repressor / biotin---[acetyl-CoA-carboxylase] ligase
MRRHQIGADFPELLNAVRQRCVLTGHEVRLLTAGGPRAGMVEGIADGGELLLRTPQGTVKIIQADEVRLA